MENNNEVKYSTLERYREDCTRENRKICKKKILYLFTLKRVGHCVHIMTYTCSYEKAIWKSTSPHIISIKDDSAFLTSDSIVLMPFILSTPHHGFKLSQGRAVIE